MRFWNLILVAAFIWDWSDPISAGKKMGGLFREWCVKGNESEGNWEFHWRVWESDPSVTWPDDGCVAVFQQTSPTYAYLPKSLSSYHLPFRLPICNLWLAKCRYGVFSGLNKDKKIDCSFLIFFWGRKKKFDCKVWIFVSQVFIYLSRRQISRGRACNTVRSPQL